MPQEYEYNFGNFNKKDMITKIKSLNAIKFGHFIFKVIVFIHPFKKEGTYIRVRDEGHRITMTYKYINKNNEFDEEDEIIIDDFDSAVNILYGIGCTKKYYYEKMREIWKYKNTEFVFDITPGAPSEILEIESNTKKELDSIVKKLDIEEYKLDRNRSLLVDTIKSKFDIIIPKQIDLTFTNVKKQLLPLCKKNKKEFIKLINEHIKIYKKLI